jgi:hypothetical protein
MRPKQWGVQLTEEERQPLQEMLRKGTHNSRVLNRARILLLAHEGRYDHEVAHIMGVTAQTVAHVRKRYAQGGLEAALYDRPHRRRPPPGGASGSLRDRPGPKPTSRGTAAVDAPTPGGPVGRIGRGLGHLSGDGSAGVKKTLFSPGAGGSGAFPP